MANHAESGAVDATERDAATPETQLRGRSVVHAKIVDVAYARTEETPYGLLFHVLHGGVIGRAQDTARAVRRRDPVIRAALVAQRRQSDGSQHEREGFADCRGCGSPTTRPCNATRRIADGCRRGWCVPCAAWKPACWLCSGGASATGQVEDAGSFTGPLD